MDTEVNSKRGLVISLVVVTIIIFVGLVWLIATRIPWNRQGSQTPSVTPGVPALQNCAYPITYWREHPELYPDEIIIGGVAYQERELQALLLDDAQNLTQQLRAQMAVAFLNISGGADQSSIEATIFNAYGWLVNHPVESEISSDELEAGRRFFSMLEAYNQGQAGVKACEITAPATEAVTSTATQTTTVLPSSTASQTLTPTPSETATIGSTPTATYPFTFPTNTAVATTKPPVYPSYTPMSTNTPVTPTVQPSPTKTPNPPTVTPTLPPIPSPAPTLPSN